MWPTEQFEFETPDLNIVYKPVLILTGHLMS